jgi:hypothetical protein
MSEIKKNTLSVRSHAEIYGEFANVTSSGDRDSKSFRQKCTVVDTWKNFGGNWQVVTRTGDCAEY